MNTLKPLKQEDFKITLVEDLGRIYPKSNSKTKQRYGIFLCGKCHKPHKKPVQSAKDGSTKCTPCAMTTHGNSYHRLYATWLHEVKRCTDKGNDRYKDYGGRGISMSTEFLLDFKVWLHYVESLDNCYKDTYTLDRIDNDGHYERGNLRWATKQEQVLNSRTFIGSPGVRPILD